MSALGLLGALLLLVLAAVIRAAGASLARTSRADALHDAAEGDERATRVAELLDDRAILQPALTSVSAFVLVAAAILATWSLTDEVRGTALFGALVGLGLVVVLVGDLLPRSWGRSRPRRMAYRFSGLLARTVQLGGWAVDLVADEEAEEEETLPSDEAAQDEEERVLIGQVLEFTDAVVREVMVPRTDMTVITGEADSEEAIDLALEEGYSRIPVTREGPDDIVGILYSRDLLRLKDMDEVPRPVRDLMRPARFVPETKRISELLREMQADQAHMAIVVDEFGGTAGLVTIEDIIEELVGEIADEFDSEEPLVTDIEGGYLVDGRLPVDELASLVEMPLPDDEWDTVGGLVLGLAGRVPKEGESFELQGLTLTADRVQGRRVAMVRCRVG
jgi:CBS domain containing-hemolysin-like protein